MNSAHDFVLSGTRGGPIRSQILRLLDERPRTATELAERLPLDEKAVQQHLQVMLQNHIVEKQRQDHEAVYIPSG